MALLYAPDDFSLAQTIVCTSGWDTDCNAGNVGCLMGAMLGLEGIEAGRDWRGPIADRMLISSADGGAAINDAVRVSARLVDLGRKLAGLPPLVAPKNGAQFHFSLPGSAQGFMPAAGDSRLDLANVPFERGRALQARYSGVGPEPAAVLTPTFAPPDVTRMRTYELMATPLLYPGQTVRARVIADPLNAGVCPRRRARPRLRRRRRPCAARWRTGCSSARRGDRSDLASARYGRSAHPIDRPCPSLACGRSERLGHARLSPMGRTAGRAPPAAERAWRLLATSLGQRSRAFSRPTFRRPFASRRTAARA